MILVVGATGQLGGAITRALLGRGRDVRILVRHDSPSAALAGQGLATSADALIAAGAQPVYGDLKDPGSLGAACAGVDVLITTANSAMRGGPDTIETVDLAGNRNLIDAAKAAGVRQFIFVSALGAAPEHPVPMFMAKGRTEEHLRSSGLTWTILSPTAFMEVWPVMVVGMPVAMGQPVTLVGEGRSRSSFVSAGDVAAYAVAAVDNPAATDQLVVISGPEALSYRDVVAVYERAFGRTIQVNSVAPGEPVPGLPPTMSQMLAGMDFDMIVDSNAAARTFGVHQTSLAELLGRPPTAVPG
jgi:uncharacterized protein YbjT (DUF2867 family)